MKILLVSDSHGNNSALDELAIKYPNMDLYLHAGDSASTSWSIQPFESVLGNCDYYDDFPRFMKLPIPGGYLYMQHHPTIDTRMLKLDHVRLFIHGHAHRRRLEAIDGITFVNPGAISFPRDGFDLSYAIIEVDEKNIKVDFYQMES